MLGRSYTQKEVTLDNEVIFNPNYLKGCVAKWIQIIALTDILCVSGVFTYIILHN